MLTYALSTWSRILLNKFLHQWGVAWRWSARGSAEMLWKPRLALIAAFSSSVWLGLVSLICLLTIQNRNSVGFRSGLLAGPVMPWSVHPLLLVLALWEGPSAFGKAHHNVHEACQCTEAQSALKSLGRWLCWLFCWLKTQGSKNTIALYCWWWCTLFYQAFFILFHLPRDFRALCASVHWQALWTLWYPFPKALGPSHRAKTTRNGWPWYYWAS